MSTVTRPKSRLRTGLWLALVVIIAISIVAFGARPALRVVYPYHYRSEVEHYASLHGLDPRLVAAVVRVESRFNPMAVSPKGARGLMQVLPSTGAWVAGQIGLEGFDEEALYVPAVSLRLGTWYLAYLLAEFEHRVPLALAAYNGGVNNVRGWVSAGLWNGTADDLESIPFAETRNYVRRILTDFRVYRFLYPE